MQKKSLNRTSTTQSAIFSKLSKCFYKEEALSRRLKHLHEENAELEEQIKKKQQEIHDERTVIAYQMGELTRAVSNKVNVVDEFKINREMFKDEQTCEQTIKNSMGKYETIEKEEKMISRMRVNLEKIEKTYTEHKESLSKILEESTCLHLNTVQKMKKSIADKRQEYEKLNLQNIKKQEDMNAMEEKRMKFEDSEQDLIDEEKKLKEEIQKRMKTINERKEKVKQMNRWEAIIIDRKRRNELYGQINEKNKMLNALLEGNRNLEMNINEESMVSTNYSKSVQNAHDRQVQ